MTYNTSEELTSEKNDIVAPATATSHSAPIAIVRLSGENCHTKLKKTLKDGIETTPNYLRRASFLDSETKELIDDAMVVFFKGPHSYTGEDSAEIHLHGSPFIVRKALKVLQKVGFRLAEPGEFTKRAYLNEKLDLVASEGVSSLIASSSEQEWMSAKYLLEGKLQGTIKALRTSLVEVMSFLEAQIDFPEEEEITALSRKGVKEKAEKVLLSISKLVSSYENGKITSEGLKVALIGPPNAGKSSLMNEFLQKERAIVTDTPGTTRDYLEERCLLNGRLVSLVDTAGLRNTNDLIEKQGVAKAKEIAKDVDLILFLFPSDQTKEDFDQFNIAITDLKKLCHLNIQTKSDLEKKNYFWDEKDEALLISCKSKENLETLNKKIIEKIDYHTNEFKNNVSITSTRHLTLLQEAERRLDKFVSEFNQADYEEILAFELREINEHLSKIVGAISTDDLLEEIFSKFCIGK